MIWSKYLAVGLLALYVYVLIVLILKYDFASLYHPSKFPLLNRMRHHQSKEMSRGSNILKIYIYDWNETISDRWPNSYSHHRLSLLPSYKENNGTGRIIDPSIGLHATHQYSLFTIFLASLKASPFVTNNPIDADFFFIPYDLGMDSSTRKTDGALAATNCPMLPSVIELLEHSPYFQKSKGRNHILIHSINQPMTFFVNKNCRKLYEYCVDCIKLSIDTYSASTYEFLKSLPYMTQNWHSVPFPANFHLSSRVSNPLWRKIIDSPTNYYPHTYCLERPKQLCFIGSTEVTAKKQRMLRTLLLSECHRLGNDSCWAQELSSHSSNQYFSVPGEKERTQLSQSQYQSRDLNPYSQCRLCLCPGGDFPTRKALFDVLLSGCIPVIFEKEAALTQWPWHWGNLSTAQEATVFIDREPLFKAADRSEIDNRISSIFSYLLNLSEDMDRIKTRLYAIATVAERMQYSLPSDKNAIAKTKDAFDIIIDKLNEMRIS